MNLRTPLGRLRVLAILEGISYLLLGITMPIKYVMGVPEPNYIVGMAHGWLFIMYVAIAIQNSRIHNWTWKETFYVLVASLIPFGTFAVDIKILKPIYSRIK